VTAVKKGGGGGVATILLGKLVRPREDLTSCWPWKGRYDENARRVSAEEPRRPDAQLIRDQYRREILDERATVVAAFKERDGGTTEFKLTLASTRGEMGTVYAEHVALVLDAPDFMQNAQAAGPVRRICSTCDAREDSHPTALCSKGFNDVERIREARWIAPETE
jgi:hypothetical protein